MGSKHLSNDEVCVELAQSTKNSILTFSQFLSRLSTLLSATHAASHGSVYLSQKSLSPTAAAAATAELPNPPPSQPLVLVRATNGKSKEHRKKGEKEKLSTVVEVSGLDEFYRRYADVCKKGMAGLRKRDRKGRKRKEREKGKGKKAVVAGQKRSS